MITMDVNDRLSGNFDQENGGPVSAHAFDKAEPGEQEVGNHQEPASSGLRATFNKLIWHGGSVYDAWLNAVSAQVSIHLRLKDLFH